MEGKKWLDYVGFQLAGILQKMFRGIPHSTSFKNLEELKKVMSKCIKNGEWIEDEKGNKLDIDLREICISRF